MRRFGLLTLTVLLVLAQPAAAQPFGEFALRDEPASLPEVGFANEAGRPGRLADFQGKVVLLNIWATWCLPCREEMPTLDRLQAKLGGSDFEVVALSIDRAGPEAVQAFYAEIGIENLALRIDDSGRAAGTLGAVGLPTTILIDREGRDLGRLIGPSEWDKPEMVAFLRTIITPSPDSLASATE